MRVMASNSGLYAIMAPESALISLARRVAEGPIVGDEVTLLSFLPGSQGNTQLSPHSAAAYDLRKLARLRRMLSALRRSATSTVDATLSGALLEVLTQRLVEVREASDESDDSVDVVDLGTVASVHVSLGLPKPRLTAIPELKPSLGRPDTELQLCVASYTKAIALSRGLGRSKKHVKRELFNSMRLALLGVDCILCAPVVVQAGQPRLQGTGSRLLTRARIELTCICQELSSQYELPFPNAERERQILKSAMPSPRPARIG